MGSRAYGARVKVRHIQVATLAEAQRIENHLAAEGADFAALARNFSANPNTAPAGGMLRVFSREDDDVPELMRRTAFALEPGEHSAPLRIDEWYHILKVEERYPPEQVAFNRPAQRYAKVGIPTSPPPAGRALKTGVSRRAQRG